MSLWDNLTTTINGWKADIEKSFARFKGKGFSKACMATCALIAAADGSISAAEKGKMMGFIRINDVLKGQDAAKLKEHFDFFASKLEADFDFGKIECVQAIEAVKKEDGAGRAIIQLGIAIGGADGNFDDKEKAVVREICNLFSIPPADFNL